MSAWLIIYVRLFISKSSPWLWYNINSNFPLYS